MSKLGTADFDQLRLLLHKRIERCSPAELEAVRKLLLECEAKQLFATMASDAGADRLSGKHDPVLVKAAVQEHRARISLFVTVVLETNVVLQARASGARIPILSFFIARFLIHSRP